MRKVLAAPDRDLLSAYAQWFYDRGEALETVFDAVQLITLTSGGTPGVCAMDSRLPLRSRPALISLMQERGWRVILLIRDGDDAGADAALRYPFTPEQLQETFDKAGDAV